MSKRSNNSGVGSSPFPERDQLAQVLGEAHPRSVDVEEPRSLGDPEGMDGAGRGHGEPAGSEQHCLRLRRGHFELTFEHVEGVGVPLMDMEVAHGRGLHGVLGDVQALDVDLHVADGGATRDRLASARLDHDHLFHRSPP